MGISLSAECEPITTVGGCVNVVSGQFFQIDKDLVPNTLEPITLTRFYDGASVMESFMGTGYGSQFPLMASEVQKGFRHSYVLISERDGFLVPYRGKKADHDNRCKIDPRVLKKGYTNLSWVQASGATNFINWKVTLGDGSKRFYKKKIKLHKEQREHVGFPTKQAFLLTEKIKPNGNRIKYKYKEIGEKPFLSKVGTFNRSGTTENK